MSMKPAIRNWQSQPPNGGWAVEYVLPGTEQKWFFKGLPNAIVEAIADVQQANKIFDGYGPIWDMLNKIWTTRDPHRALDYTLSDGTRKQRLVSGKIVPPTSRAALRARISKPCSRC